MQHILLINEIDKRIARLRLLPVELTELAQVDRGTYYRARRLPGSTSVRNMEKLTAALIAAEIELRDYLVALHPLDTPKMEAAE